MNAREAAFKALLDIEQNGAYVNTEILKMLSEPDFEEKDKALFSALTVGVIKNKLRLDYVIKQFSKTRLKKLSLKVLIILRMGAYQILFLDKVPESAACNESVKLTKKYFNLKSTGFVNGILRNIARNSEKIVYPPRDNITEFLSVEYSFPMWICEKLVIQYGAEKAEDFMKNSNEPHGVFIRVNRLKTSADELLNIFKTKDINAEVVGDDMLYITSAANLINFDEYKSGMFSIQNYSSAKAAEILEPKENETVIDVCAAPGGKSCAAAEKMNNRGTVYSFDIYEHKINLIKNSAERLGISIINAEVNDGENPKKELFGKADRVILDAPCSGIGVIHKKPDIKWTRNSEDIAELAKLQRSLLQKSKNYLKPGGIMLYSTCTVFKEENEENIKWFLSSSSDFEKVYEEQILTDEKGESGFYICKLKKLS